MGVLLVNLGTPDAPDKASVRRYLKEFLWDPRVVEVPRPIWWLVLNGVILNTRPKRSAAAYAKIWTEQGSPLLTISKAQQQAMQKMLTEENDFAVEVVLAMRYGNPSIRQGLKKLQDAGARKILVLPLYPQYSATTTASIFDAVTDEVKSWRWIPELRFINHYHDHDGYIDALTQSVTKHRDEKGKADLLLMSFHGIPREYFDKGDPYYCECQKTGRLLAEKLGLADNEWKISFQSRLGPKDWLRPYTDETLEQLAKDGIKNVQVICPGFSVDCLETLEEIAMENRDIFLEAGGETYDYIPCLNDQPMHMEFLSKLVMQHLDGWTRLPTGTELTQRKERAIEMGSEH